MTIRKTAAAFLLGLVLVAGLPAVSDAAHKHYRGCGHRVEKADDRYYGYDSRYRYYDDGRVDYDAPYVARHGSGRRYDYDYRDYGYRDDGYRDYDYRDYRARRYTRGYYSPRYYGSRRVGYHYHGRSRCYSSHRPHVHFGIHLGF